MDQTPREPCHGSRSESGGVTLIPQAKNMHTFVDRVTRVKEESAGLKRYLHALPPAAWEHPSACARWGIGDVVTHLVDSGAFYTESIVRGLQGECTPFASRPPAGSHGASAAVLTATPGCGTAASWGVRVLTAFDDTTDRFNHLVTWSALTSRQRQRSPLHPPWQQGAN